MVIYGVGDFKEEIMEDYNKNLRVFFKRCRLKGIKFNYKLKLVCSEILYMGYFVIDKDFKVDLDKVIVVINMLVLNNVILDNVIIV